MTNTTTMPPAEKSLMPQERAVQRFVVVAGPCVLEGDGGINRETAEELKRITDGISGVEFYFKSSFDKANRSSIDSYRGPGLTNGLKMLENIKSELGVKLLTDIHEIDQVEPTAQVVDMLQIPAFLCRQTDLLLAAGRSGVAVNLKKGQFLSPHDIIHGAKKIQSTGNQNIWITERGTTFGYNNLVVDMRSIPIVQNYGLPLIFDATHSVQLPGGQGTTSGGQREFAPILARAAVASGCNGLFFETHPNPQAALSDGANMIPLANVEAMLKQLMQIHEVVQPVLAS